MYFDSRKILLALASFVFTFVILEIILRVLGYAPGQHTKVYYFDEVDSLYTKSGFVTDEDGIFKLDTTAGKRIEQKIAKNDGSYSESEASNVYCLAFDNLQLVNGELKNALAERYFSLLKKSTENLSELERAIVQYVRSPVNSDGFRSIEFKPYKNDKPSVLLIGDSFTFGHSASNKNNSFADQLLADGFTVYNAGITASDVAQYLAIAKKYIPVLKPDLVVVNFYIGNDISYYKREVKPGYPVFYSTNAGNLIACPHGKYFESAQEVYDFMINQWHVPDNEGIFAYLMSKTVISSLAWRAMVKTGIKRCNSQACCDYYNEVLPKATKKPYSTHELKEIKAIADENGAAFILSSIPEVYRFKANSISDYPGLFEELQYYEMPINRENYNLHDAHFNDTGHYHYAKFLEQIIQDFE